MSPAAQPAIFTVDATDGTPRLLKNGTQIFPMMFWQTSMTEEDGRAFSDAGVELFTFTRSFQAYEHPFLVGENQYDFTFFDQEMHKFTTACPGKYCIPRVFLSAPYWWLEAHPEECCEYGLPQAKYRHGQGPMTQGTLHESFASLRWRKDMGDALRELIRHIQASEYANAVVGLHLANGHCGEWHYWGGGSAPDTSVPMQQYLGMPPTPNPMERTPEYYDRFFQCEADAILHFARIAKEESRGRLLTVVFYCYQPSGGPLEPHHRGAAAILDSPLVDIVTAPHSYTFRAPGNMAYFRNFPASVAAHGKLFVDESDDRTYLARRKHPEISSPLGASTPEGSAMVLRREFGYALTHNIGLWYMDIDDDMFHSPALMAEIAAMKRWGDASIAAPRPRCSQVALVYDMRGAYYLPKCFTTPPIPPKTFGQAFPLLSLTPLRLDALCRAGAPFDCYLASDLTRPEMARYKVLIFVDLVAPTQAMRQAIEALKSDGRTLVWSYSSGLFRDGSPSLDAMKELTGLDDFQKTDSLDIPETPFNPPITMAPGILPLEASRDFASWRSVYSWNPNLPVEFLRREYARAGVWNYLDTPDVLSVSSGALMLHATTAGTKNIRLPKPKYVTDIMENRRLGLRDTLEIPMKQNETKLYLLDNAPPAHEN